MSDEEPKCIAIDEKTDHEIVHRRRLRQANRATHEPLDPRPQIAVFTLDSLRVLLANVMLRWIDMPFVRSPSVGVKSRDAKGLQQVLEFEKDGILPSPKDVRQHRATVMIDGMP
jgi:hypothetical protein